jgi:hypothetical protein
VLTAAGFAGLLTQMPGGELLDAIQSKRTLAASDPKGALGVAEDGQRGWELGSSPRRFTVARASRIVDRYWTENSDQKRLQVSDFIQTSVSHRT